LCTIIYLYCYLGAHKCLDLDPGIVNGLMSNTKNMSTRVPYAYPMRLGTYPINSYHEYTTFLLSLVPYPKPIKLGSKGSSTKLRGAVKHFKKPKNPKKFKNFKNFKKIKNIAKMSATALVIALSSKSYISTNFGKANKKFYRKFFHLKSKIRTSKSGLRTEFGGGRRNNPRNRGVVIIPEIGG
jgi:hypothetical protein